MIATLALPLTVAAPVASPASAAPVVGTPISLPAGSGPAAVAFSPDGTKAYVANQGTSTVSVISVATGALQAPITLPENSYPASVAFSPDGRTAYVANANASTVSVITVATDTLASPISLPAGSGPYSVAFSPDGSKAYVANAYASTVSVIIVFQPEIASVPLTLKTGRTTTTSVTLRWKTPVTLNGGVITECLIQYRRTGTSNWLTFAHTPSSARARRVTGLTARTTYQFKVAAKTAAGTSAYTAPITKNTLAR